MAQIDFGVKGKVLNLSEQDASCDYEWLGVILQISQLWKVGKQWDWLIFGGKLKIKNRRSANANAKPSDPLIVMSSWGAAKWQKLEEKEDRDVPGQGWGRRGQWDGDTKSAAYDFKLCPQTRWQPPAGQLPAADKAQWPPPTEPPATRPPATEPPATRQSSTRQSSTRPNPARTSPGNGQLPLSVKPQPHNVQLQPNPSRPESKSNPKPKPKAKPWSWSKSEPKANEPLAARGLPWSSCFRWKDLLVFYDDWTRITSNLYLSAAKKVIIVTGSRLSPSSPRGGEPLRKVWLKFDS